MEDIITLNERDFLVAKKLNYNNINYSLVISMDNENDIALLKESFENGEVYVSSITDEKEYETIKKLMTSEN